jgi:hypothetical protein
MSKANLNLNLNLNGNASPSLARLTASSIRFNSYKITQQAFRAEMGRSLLSKALSAGRTAPYNGGWDPEHLAWVYVSEFVEKNLQWYKDLEKAAKPLWSRSRGGDKLIVAVKELINFAGEREDRFAEIIDQHDGEGAINYWLGMLNIHPAQHPNTFLLIRVARKIGEMAVMRLKHHFNAARPSQLCPAIVPMLDPPGTPSYPSGHALQAYLISCILVRAFPNVPQSTVPERWDNPETHSGLFALSRRVADNRKIAGLHFDVDNEAGFVLAKKIDNLLGALPPTSRFQALISAVRKELPQYK